MDEYTITKRIAKHGKDTPMILVPTTLKNKIPAGTLAQITIRVIELPNTEAP